MDDGSQIAQAFCDARRNHEELAAFPGVMPESMNEGYALQDQAIKLWGEPVGGWKVGGLPEPHASHFGASHVAGPVFADEIVMADGQMQAMPVLKGFAAVELELALQIGQVPGENASLDEIKDCISDIRLAVEIASSPYAGINSHGPAPMLAGFGNNNGLLLGERLDRNSWPETAGAAITNIDGEEIARREIAGIGDAPFRAFRFLMSNLAARNIQVKPGQWVSSGALTGCHEITPGQRAEFRFGGDLEIGCDIIASG